MIKKLLYHIYVFCIKRFGYSNPYQAREIISWLKEDFKYRKTIGYRNMLKAYSNGFTAILYYKLKSAKISIKYCLPDLYYLKMHPINGQFSHWIDDKLTLKYLLAKYDAYLPEYYGFLKRGRFIRLMDYPLLLPCDFGGLLELLHQKTELALKKNASSNSVGFFNVKYSNGSYFINGNLISEKEFSVFIQSLDEYLVTEYVHAHSFLKNINILSPNIIRLMVVNMDGYNPKLIASYLRIGQRSTGYTELTSSGGLFCGVNLENGRLFEPKLFDGPIVKDTPLHPDTKISIEGTLPNWNKLVDIILDICRYLANLKYLGFDIIITESSFKIIEINSLSGISYMQLFYPLLNSPLGKSFFHSLGLEIAAN
jgi:hypothetical protein